MSKQVKNTKVISSSPLAAAKAARPSSKREKEVVVEKDVKREGKGKKKKGKGKKGEGKSLERRILGQVGGVLHAVLGDDDWIDFGAKVASGLFEGAKFAAPYAAAALLASPHGPRTLFRAPVKGHPDPLPPRMKVARQVKFNSDGIPVITGQTTTIRELHMPLRAHDLAVGSETPAGVPFSSPVSISEFSESHTYEADGGSSCLAVSGRMKLFDMPVSAVRGTVMLSLPLDMGETLLAHVRMHEQLKLFNRVKFVKIAAVYAPGADYTESGQFMFLGASDPTRTILNFPTGEDRVRAATEYGVSGSAITRLFTGVSFLVPLDGPIKFQDMVPSANNTVAGLRDVAAGIFEIMASGSWTTPGDSPGQVWLEYECVGIDPVPDYGSVASSDSACTFFSVGPNSNSTTKLMVNNWSFNDMMGGVSNTPVSPANGDSNRFSLFDSGMPTAILADGDGNSLTTKWKSGGPAALGFAMRNSTTVNAEIAPPIGTYDFAWIVGYKRASASPATSPLGSLVNGPQIAVNSGTGITISAQTGSASNLNGAAGYSYLQGRQRLVCTDTASTFNYFWTRAQPLPGTTFSGPDVLYFFVTWTRVYSTSPRTCLMDMISERYRHLINPWDKYYPLMVAPLVVDTAEDEVERAVAALDARKIALSCPRLDVVALANQKLAGISHPFQVKNGPQEPPGPSALYSLCPYIARCWAGCLSLRPESFVDSQGVLVGMFVSSLIEAIKVLDSSTTTNSLHLAYDSVRHALVDKSLALSIFRSDFSSILSPSDLEWIELLTPCLRRAAGIISSSDCPARDGLEYIISCNLSYPDRNL